MTIHILALLFGLFLSIKARMFKERPNVVIFHIIMLWCVYASFQVPGLLKLRWPVAIVGGIFAFFFWCSRRPPFESVQKLSLTLVIFFTISAAYSLVPDYSILRSGALFFLISLFVFGGAAMLSDPGALNGAFKSFVIVACVSTIYIAAGYQTASPMEDTGATRFTLEGLKATGTAGIALFACIFLSYTLKYSRSTVLRIGIAFLYCLLLYIMLTTRTRGILLSALIILPFLWVALLGQGRFHILIGVYCLICLAVPIAVSMSGKQEQIFTFLRISDSEEMTRTRLEGRWDVAFSKALERPILGRGFGSSRYFEIDDEALVTLGRSINDRYRLTHNQYLAVFYEIGIFGLLLFVAMLVAVGIRGWQIFQAPSTPERDRLICMLAFWCSHVIGMLFHDGRFTLGNPGAYWFWFACIYLSMGGSYLRQGRLQANPGMGPPMGPGMMPPQGPGFFPPPPSSGYGYGIPPRP